MLNNRCGNFNITMSCWVYWHYYIGIIFFGSRVTTKICIVAINYRHFQIWKIQTGFLSVEDSDMQNRWKFIKTWLLKNSVNLFQKCEGFEAKRMTSKIFQKSHAEGFGSFTLLIFIELKIEESKLNTKDIFVNSIGKI